MMATRCTTVIFAHLENKTTSSNVQKHVVNNKLGLVYMSRVMMYYSTEVIDNHLKKQGYGQAKWLGSMGLGRHFVIEEKAR